MSSTHLSTQDVRHIAKLANLTLTDAKITKFSHQLSDILGYVAKLQAVDATAVSETNQVTGLKNVFFEDGTAPITSLSQTAVTAQAKLSHNGYVAVPAVIEKV